MFHALFGCRERGKEGLNFFLSLSLIVMRREFLRSLALLLCCTVGGGGREEGGGGREEGDRKNSKRSGPQHKSPAFSYTQPDCWLVVLVRVHLHCTTVGLKHSSLPIMC